MKKTFVFLFLVMALTLTACGPSAPAYSNTINVKMNEFMYDPGAFAVPAGQEITLNATNEGKVEHEFVIIKLGQEVTVPFDADDEDKVFWEHEVGPGESATVTFTAPSEPGEYVLLCGISGHFEAGMAGKLTVVAP